MCGICGIVSTGADWDALPPAIQRMTTALRHRGPDGEGNVLFGPPDLPRPVALGHTRLAVIDLSDAGLEPMPNEDETVWVILNGEIYNFPELRRNLESKGHIFRSRTDTEVIVHLYEEKGTRAFAELNGMFAIALLDLRERRLLLARDHLGIKPLYYSHRGSRLLFGSEIKALLASGMADVEVDWQAIGDYFTYLYVPSPQTAFRDIMQLPPAHILAVDLQDGSSHLDRYWRVERMPEIEVAPVQDLQSHIRELLTDSVRRQLVSDVPLGVFLSGGIDSTIIAGLAREIQGSIRTFTVAFTDAELAFYDESRLARATSRHLHTDHLELPLALPNPVEMLRLIDAFDQPFGNPTYYLMNLISQRAREHVTVALCGAGGDELYAGYPRYRAVQLARRMRGVPVPVLRAGGLPLRLARDTYGTMRLRRARQFFEGLDKDPVRQFVAWTYFMDEPAKKKLLNGHGRDNLPAERVVRDALQASALADDENHFLEADVHTFLLDNLLEYTDKMSMDVALEMRVPLLDYRFVQTSLNIPFRYKLSGGRTKALLRDTFADFFSPEVSSAPKRGFNAPLAHWMTHTLDGYFAAAEDASHPYHAALGDDIGVTWRSGILDTHVIGSLRRRLASGRADTSYELFGIIAFDVWWRTYVLQSTGTGMRASQTPSLP